ncbi:MAG: hypothetical protein L0K86_21965 [Actinomycetia bacterium]|nr:hypothetical protein [Actinomycetes bacterium]
MTTSIGDAKGAVLAANTEGEQAVASVQAVITSLERQRAALMAAAHGTCQADAEHAARAITAVIEHFHEGIRMSAQASQHVQDVAGRL